MPKKMLIDATHAEETRVVVVDGNKVEEFDFESENKRQLAGNIYLAKVTRVEPSLQAAFIDYGGNRHGFLAFSEIHPDYYQIPVADREALLAEERAYAASQDDDEPEKPNRGRRRRTKAAAAKSDDQIVAQDVDAAPSNIPGMDVVDLDADADDALIDPDADPVVTSSSAWEPNQDAAENETGAESAAAGDRAEVATADSDENADAAPEDRADESADDGDDNGTEGLRDASARDADIESVADEDVTEEIRQRRKPRPRRYKIQEVVKVRQILLVQVVKEERGNKGAALTTYLSLAGRYCVLMPNTARGGGISRKITNAADRKKLKDIAGEIEVPEGAGLIVRTAGAKRTKSEIKRDYEYLQRLWEQTRELTLKSTAPAKIYEEGDLIKRSIRDHYNREIDEVFVEGEAGYRTAKDFMKMIMPSHAKNVKHYSEGLPIFARFQVESYLAEMFNPTVQLKSGGYIVIGVTEALVAIDVNSGRATKEGSIEETALKTNLEASDEVARQLRLRDLAGLIVIDYIDMEERRNNSAVEKRLKDKLKTDRARIQVGRISGFGLLEMSRQRLRPGMLEATTGPCPSCHGTGLVRSNDSLGLSILRQLEEEGVRGRSREVLITAPVGIVNFLINNKREHIAQIEARYGISIRVEADPFLISPDFAIERFKTQSRVVAAAAPVVSLDTTSIPDIDEAEEDTVVAEVRSESDEGAPKKRRRRHRRRRGGGSGDEAQAESTAPAPDEARAEPLAEAEEKPKPKRARSRSRKKVEETAETASAAQPAADVAEASAEAPAEAEEKPKRKRTRTRTKPEATATETVSDRAEAAPVPDPTPANDPAPAPEPAMVGAAAEPAAPGPAPDDRPKRRGWWSKGG